MFDRRRCSSPRGACRRMALSGVIAVVLNGTITPASYHGWNASALGGQPRPRKEFATDLEKDKAAAAERKLLADLDKAITEHADHLDYTRLDRALAAAFRGYGLDLDVIDAKTAGARLAGRTWTAEVASMIDEWCRVRKTRMKLDTWRRLLNVALAADPDPWRNTLRDQFERPPAAAVKDLRQLSRDEKALEQQPLNSLLILATMLHEGSNDTLAAGAVVQVARRRFPKDFWACLLQGALELEGIHNPDPVAAARAFNAAVALRPQSPAARVNLAAALHDQQKLDEALAACREAIRLSPDYAVAHNNLASALHAQEKFDESEAALAEAQRLDPNIGEQP